MPHQKLRAVFKPTKAGGWELIVRVRPVSKEIRGDGGLIQLVNIEGPMAGLTIPYYGTKIQPWIVVKVFAKVPHGLKQRANQFRALEAQVIDKNIIL